MPANPYKDELRMRKQIDIILTQTLKTLEEGLDYNQFILQVLLSHPVGEMQVERFVKKYYVNSGIIKIENGTILRGDGNVLHEK